LNFITAVRVQVHEFNDLEALSARPMPARRRPLRAWMAQRLGPGNVDTFNRWLREWCHGAAAANGRCRRMGQVKRNAVLLSGAPLQCRRVVPRAPCRVSHVNGPAVAAGRVRARRQRRKSVLPIGAKTPAVRDDSEISSLAIRCDHMTSGPTLPTVSTDVFTSRRWYEIARAVIPAETSTTAKAGTGSFHSR